MLKVLIHWIEIHCRNYFWFRALWFFILSFFICYNGTNQKMCLTTCVWIIFQKSFNYTFSVIILEGKMLSLHVFHAKLKLIRNDLITQRLVFCSSTYVTRGRISSKFSISTYLGNFLHTINDIIHLKRAFTYLSHSITLSFLRKIFLRHFFVVLNCHEEYRGKIWFFSHKSFMQKKMW